MIDWSEILKRYGNRPLFLMENGSICYSEFVDLVRENVIKGPADSAISQSLEWTAESFARLLGALDSGRSVVLNESITAPDLRHFPNGKPFLILRSGGTTGEPRHVVHSFETLLLPYSFKARDPQRILILYAADHIAGLDAFFQAIHRGSSLVVPSGRDADSIGKAIEQNRASVLPTTPTFLQFLLLSGINELYNLDSVEAIPHGAEPMSDPLRNRLIRAFPKARLIHRFGLTEMGALPVREDPESPEALFLDAPGYSWKLEGGEIKIQGLTPFLGTLEEGPISGEDYWHATGDIGEQTKRGSIRVLGRRESLINVGGEKVFPEQVESFILEDEDVRDALVMAVPSSLSGQAVVAKIVFAGEPDELGLIRRLRKRATEKGISLAKVPTRIESVERIEKTDVGKRFRGNGKT